MASERDIQTARGLLLEAPFDPELWPQALTAVARAVGGRSGQLVGMDGQGDFTVHWLTGIADDERREIEAFGLADPKINPRLRIGLHAPLMRLVADQDHIDADVRRCHPIYAEVFDRLDLAHNCQVVLRREEDLLLRASVTRSRGEGPFRAEDFRAFAALAPHLEAAVRLQIALETTRARAMLESLEAVRTPAFVLDGSGRVIDASVSAHLLASVGDVIRVRTGRLEAAMAQDQRALADAIDGALAILRGEEGAAGGAVWLNSASQGGGLAFEVRPLTAHRPALGRGAAVIVAARRHPTAGSMDAHAVWLDLSGVRRAFGLTAAEAEVAQLLANGLASNDIAARRGVSPETVHSQVKAVLAKTRCDRRARLASVLRAFMLN
jgi:DNA-binding CsgD family transcriptional regulator